MHLEDYVQPSVTRKGSRSLHPSQLQKQPVKEPFSLSSFLAKQSPSQTHSSTTILTAVNIPSNHTARLSPSPYTDRLPERNDFATMFSPRISPTRLFELDRVQFNLDGKGTHLAVGDNTLYLVTDNIYLTRIDLTVERGIERSQLFFFLLQLEI